MSRQCACRYVGKCGCDRLNILSNRVEFVLDQRTHLWSYFEIPLVGRAAGPESGSLVHCGCIVGDNDQYTNILAKLIVSLRGQPTTWWRHHIVCQKTIGRIRLSVSTVNRTYELTGITHVTPFRKYGKHSTGPSTYGAWVRTYSKLFSCKSVLTVCSYRAQANEICTYGRLSRGSLARVRGYGLPYLRTVEYDHCGHGIGVFP